MWKFVAILIAIPLLAACQDDASIAKHNMTKAADNFEIMRRVVLYNAIRGENIMVSEGRCSITPGVVRISVICKVGPSAYVRHFYGVSDNTLYFVEQMAAVPVNVYHFRRTFKPQSILPDIDFRGDAGAAVKAITPDKSD